MFFQMFLQLAFPHEPPVTTKEGTSISSSLMSDIFMMAPHVAHPPRCIAAFTEIKRVAIGVKHNRIRRLAAADCRIWSRRTLSSNETVQN